jgi:hypothetical protein
MNTTAVSGFNGPVVGVARGTFDFGVERTMVTTPSGAVWAFDSSGNYQVNDAFPAAAVGKRGLAWNPTSPGNFHTVSSFNIHKYSTIRMPGLSTPQPWYAATTWYDSDSVGGNHETTMSPVATFQMTRRKRITLGTTAVPDQGGTDDPNSFRVYLSGTTNARTSLWLHGAASAGNVYVNSVAFSGTNPPDPAANPNAFPGSIPGQIKNPTGSLVISGDGSIKADAISIGSAPVATTTDTQTLTNKDLRDASNAMPMRGGSGSFTGNGNGVITIPHGLGATPTWAVVIAHGTALYFATIAGFTATAITANIVHKDGTATLGAGTLTFSWVCGITTA